MPGRAPKLVDSTSAQNIPFGSLATRLERSRSLAFLLRGRDLYFSGRTRAPSGIIVAIGLVNVVQSAVASLRDMPSRECAVVVTRSRAPNSRITLRSQKQTERRGLLRRNFEVMVLGFWRQMLRWEHRKGGLERCPFTWTTTST